MSRKRCHSSDADCSMERIPSKLQKVWDPYCWLCHKLDTDQRCTTCNLSYHRKCIGFDGPKMKNYKCDLCDRMRQAQDDYAERQVDMIKLNKMLASVVNRLVKDKKFKRHKTFPEREPVHGGPSLINPFDLEIVSEKVDDNQYTSTVEFLKDIRHIRHNAEIVLTEGMKRLMIARKMEDWCAKEVYDIEMCGECFNRAVESNNRDWFTEICTPPHLLVWAKLSGHPYWPAKVIGFTSTANRLDVRFFGGDHDMANVSPHDCYLYPSRNPNRYLDAITDQDIKLSVQEASKYIRNIEAKYNCTVVEVESRKGLVVSRIGKHIIDMIPNLKLPHNFKLKRKPIYLQKSQSRKSHKSTLPAQPELTPPPSPSPSPSPPPPPTPSSLPPLSSPSFLPHSIKHSMSKADLTIMSQFTLEIHRCDNMPEYARAYEKLTNDTCLSSSNPNQCNDFYATDDESVVSQNNPNGNDDVIKEVSEVAVTEAAEAEADVAEVAAAAAEVAAAAAEVAAAAAEATVAEAPEDGNQSGNDDSFATASGSSISNKSVENFHSDTIEHCPDHKPILNDDTAASQPHTIEHVEMDTVDEPPNPSIESVDSTIVENQMHQDLDQLQLRNEKTRIGIRKIKDFLQQKLKTEMHRHNCIINQLRTTVLDHIGKNAELQAQITELKKSLAEKTAECTKLQQQHNDELTKAIEETKSKKWCVNCKAEAVITKYRLPVCSSQCLLLVWQEKFQMEKKNAMNKLGN